MKFKIINEKSSEAPFDLGKSHYKKGVRKKKFRKRADNIEYNQGRDEAARDRADKRKAKQTAKLEKELEEINKD